MQREAMHMLACWILLHISQANGLVERFNQTLNQTLQGMLAKFIDKQESWEDYLDTCVYAYNTSKHESSKHTPFEVMFGRRAVLPVTVDLNVAKHRCEPLVQEVESIADEVLESRMEERQARLESIKANILIAQQNQKEQYDRKHSKLEVYSTGACVWKKDFTRKKKCRWKARQQMGRTLQDNSFNG